MASSASSSCGGGSSSGGSGGVGRVCVECGVTGDGFKRCTRCKKEVYCSRACQKRRWKTHKETCRAPPPPSSSTGPASSSSAAAAGSSGVSSSFSSADVDAAAHPASSAAEEETAEMGVEAGAKCDDDDDGRLFHGIDEKEEKRISKRSTIDCYDYCSGCGEPRSEDRPLRRCNRCNSVWYCSQVCHERNWREPPWGKAAHVRVPWSVLGNVDPRVASAVNGQGHCIASHRAVCPLLKERRRETKKQEKRLRGAGAKSVADYVSLAEAAMGRGLLDQAVEAWRGAIRLEPTNASIHGNIAVCLIQEIGEKGLSDATVGSGDCNTH